jgi:tetratricopeptide (TPR) repeat protein
LDEHYAKESLNVNRYNFNALHALAAINAAVDNDDQLDHFAEYEKTSTITTQNEFPYQTYLEVALEYLSFGLKDDAIGVLSKAPQHPEVKIWLAYLKDDNKLLNEVAGDSPAFVFPYRTESLEPLQWAVSQNNNWRFKYFLGLNYYALQRDREAIDMFNACGDQPDYAPFYLTRSKLLKGLSDLIRANKIAPEEWRTWSYLIEYYEKNGNYEQELNFAQQASQKFKDNYTLGFALAKAQMNNRQYKASIQTLHELEVLPFEGSGEGHEVYERVHLLRAVELMEAKKYKDALKDIELSKEWPENLGEGKPYDVDTQLQDYMTAYCLRKLGRPAENKEIPGETKGNNKEILDRLKKLD